MNLYLKGNYTQNKIIEILNSNGFETQVSSKKVDLKYGIDLYLHHKTLDYKNIKVDCKKIQHHKIYDFSLFFLNLKKINNEYIVYVRSPFRKSSESNYISFVYNNNDEDLFLTPFDEFIFNNFFDNLRDYRNFFSFLDSIDNKKIEDVCPFSNVDNFCMILKTRLLSFFSKEKYSIINKKYDIHISFDNKDYERKDDISFMMHIKKKDKISWPKKSLKLTKKTENEKNI